jgi:chromate transporter
MKSTGLVVLPASLTRRALFLAFLKIGLCGFGGVAAWARRVIVEEREWLSERGYAELLGIASVLPGANTVNIAVLLGDRVGGISGSLAALAGLLVMPLLLLMGIAAVYENFAGHADVKHAAMGAAAAAAGLVIATGLKMMRNLKPDGLALVTAAALFVAVGLLQVSLALSVAISAALGIALRARMERPR